ncbi:hypothetical protein JCM3770_001783 [Rhodotorula araucariae]
MLATRVVPLLRAAAPRVTRLPRLCPSCATRPTPPPQHRLFSACTRWSAPPKPATASAKGSRIVKDEDIPHEVVVLVDPASKGLLPPSRLAELLASLDRTRYAIQLVDPAHNPPICRILDKKEQYQRERDKKAKDQERAKDPATAVGAGGGAPKEVHVTWGVSAHDLEHKLKKGKEMLAHGKRVLVCLADKKRAVKVSPEVRQQVIRQVEHELQGAGTLQDRPANRDGVVVLEFKPTAGAK